MYVQRRTIVFKKSLLKNCDEVSNIKQHSNITVNNIDKIQESITVLKEILLINECIYVPYKIDNLTATASVGKQIDVQSFLNKTRRLSCKISYNPEKFPAIFIKHRNGKILLFRSGIINILGCKSSEELNEIYSWIHTVCALT